MDALKRHILPLAYSPMRNAKLLREFQLAPTLRFKISDKLFHMTVVSTTIIYGARHLLATLSGKTAI